MSPPPMAKKRAPAPRAIPAPETFWCVRCQKRFTASHWLGDPIEPYTRKAYPMVATGELAQ